MKNNEKVIKALQALTNNTTVHTREAYDAGIVALSILEKEVINEVLIDFNEPECECGETDLYDYMKYCPNCGTKIQSV
jgi:hypothetical protein